MTVKAMKKNVWQMSKPSPYLQRSLVLDSGHLVVQVPKRSGILWKRIAHKEFGIISRTRCCWNSQKADVLFSVQRLHCPGVSSKAKDTENCRFTIVLTRQRLRLFFALSFLSISSVSTEQKAALCEEVENHQDGSGEPDVLMGQSIFLGEIKAEIPLQNENPLNHQILWQQYIERIELLSQENKVRKILYGCRISHFHSKLFVPKGQRSHELMMLDITHASQPWEGSRGAPLCGRHRGRAWSAAASPSAPLLPLARTGAVAAPPAWVGVLELSETVLDESAVPSCGAHAALAAHQASRPQSFMMMETPATVCTSTRACQVMVWYPRTTTSSAQRTCHSTPGTSPGQSQ